MSLKECKENINFFSLQFYYCTRIDESANSEKLRTTAPQYFVILMERKHFENKFGFEHICMSFSFNYFS